MFAAASPGHRHAVLECVQRTVTVTQPRKPQDLLTLLELFETLALDRGRGRRRSRTVAHRSHGHEQTGRTAARLLRVGVDMTATLTEDHVYRYLGPAKHCSA